MLKTLRDGNGQVDTHELKAALVAMAVTMQDYAAGDARDNDTCPFTHHTSRA